MKKVFTLILSLLLIGMWGCSTAKFGWEAEPEPAGEKPAPSGESGFVEDFDPMSLDEEDIQVSRDDTQVGSVRATAMMPAVDEEDVPESELVQGYRVQLYALDDEQNAFEVKKSAIFKFSHKVYLEFQAPYYKLYVGDFLKNQKKEAETLAEDAVRKGFKDAWVTPARVNPKNVPKEF